MPKKTPTKTDAAAPSTVVEPAGAEDSKPFTMPVASLAFSRNNFDARPLGISVTDNIKAGGAPNQQGYSIEYIPAIRHHRVTFRRPELDDVVGYIHESLVSCWIPAK